MALLSVVAFPWIFLAANVIGALTVLSGGFALFGWKERCQRVWLRRRPVRCSESSPRRNP
ncbi:hypothetical protein GS506_16925 [Rhodococcus hoagii]|nr:hypothetical protein [Prescottella equi]